MRQGKARQGKARQGKARQGKQKFKILNVSSVSLPVSSQKNEFQM
jgi:hypothetical protein